MRWLIKNKIALFIIFFMLTLDGHLFAQINPSTADKVKEIVAEAKATFAPDGRTKILALVSVDEQNDTYTIETTEIDAKEYIEQQIHEVAANIDITLLPDATIHDQVKGIVNLSVANLRTNLGHASEMATQILLGTPVDILQKRRGEYRVRTPEGYIAWTPAASITTMNLAEFEVWKKQKKVIYTTEFGKAYSQPSLSSLRVSDLVIGNILALQHELPDFYEVKYPDNKVGYLPKKEATIFTDWVNTRNPSSAYILESAKMMIGLPYLWGGTSVKGVDCSGFTKMAFFLNGLIIPRDASQQVLAGEHIEILSENGDLNKEKALALLKPADLLFFAEQKATNPKARVTHVAIYLGEGKFIHAAGSVRINSFLEDSDIYDSHRTNTIVAVRRYVNQQDAQIQPIKTHPFYQ